MRPEPRPDRLALAVNHGLIEKNAALEHVADRLAADDFVLRHRLRSDRLDIAEITLELRLPKGLEDESRPGARKIAVQACIGDLLLRDRLRVSAVLPSGDSTLRETRRREPPFALSASLSRPPALARAGRFRRPRAPRQDSRISHAFRVAQTPEFDPARTARRRVWHAIKIVPI
jgi:hypothetical protein